MYSCSYVCFALSVALSQNIKFHGTMIPRADDIAHGVILDDNADANHRYK